MPPPAARVAFGVQAGRVRGRPVRIGATMRMLRAIPAAPALLPISLIRRVLYPFDHAGLKSVCDGQELLCVSHFDV